MSDDDDLEKNLRVLDEKWPRVSVYIRRCIRVVQAIRRFVDARPVLRWLLPPVGATLVATAAAAFLFEVYVVAVPVAVVGWFMVQLGYDDA